MKLRLRYNRRSRKGFRNLFGYQYRKGAERRIVINLDYHDKVRREYHRGLSWLLEQLIQTLDHEIVHAFSPQDISPRSARARREETFTKWFERAGSWARR